MEPYLIERQKQERLSLVTGIVLAVAAHVLASVLLVFNGVKYIWPPPQESSFVIDFSEEEPLQNIITRGTQPRAEEVDLTRPVELVQRSESTYQGTAANLTPATAPDDFGEVEVPAIKQEETLDPRASFPGMSRKDTSLTAPHSASNASSTYKAGQPDGNTVKGKADGSATAHLKGRNVLGNIQKPVYNVQESGIVVVEIRVDNYGKVISAMPGAEGTTVTDKTLWAEARKAAMETHFNQSADAPATQVGTITYIFNLR